MFLRTDQFISSVRIEILFDLLALSWAGPTCPTCFLEISDGLRPTPVWVFPETRHTEKLFPLTCRGGKRGAK